MVWMVGVVISLSFPCLVDNSDITRHLHATRREQGNSLGFLVCLLGLHHTTPLAPLRPVTLAVASPCDGKPRDASDGRKAAAHGQYKTLGRPVKRTRERKAESEACTDKTEDKRDEVTHELLHVTHPP